jgi:hypothetical protein
MKTLLCIAVVLSLGVAAHLASGANGILVRVSGPPTLPGTVDSSLLTDVAEPEASYVSLRVEGGLIYKQTSAFRFLLEDGRHSILTLTVKGTIDEEPFAATYTSGKIELPEQKKLVTNIGFQREVISNLPVNYESLTIALDGHKFANRSELNTAVTSLATAAQEVGIIGSTTKFLGIFSAATRLIDFFDGSKLSESMGAFEFDLPKGANSKRAGWYVWFMSPNAAEYNAYLAPGASLAWNGSSLSSNGQEITNTSYVLLRLSYVKRLKKTAREAVDAYADHKKLHPWAERYQSIFHRFDSFDQVAPGTLSQGLETELRSSQTLLVNNRLLTSTEKNLIDREIRTDIRRLLAEAAGSPATGTHAQVEILQASEILRLTSIRDLASLDKTWAAQVAKLPAEEVDIAFPGDTLKLISRRWKMDPNYIKGFNPNLQMIQGTDEKLTRGAVIRVPQLPKDLRDGAVPPPPFG